MADLIDRAALLADIDGTFVFSGRVGSEFAQIRGANKIIDRIKAAPTIEAKPVVHGEWVELDVADYKCSVCGFRFTSGDPIAMFQYCRCGADMRERKET